jgi:hypothetical protein
VSSLFVAEYTGSAYPGDSRQTVAPAYPSNAEYAITLSGTSAKGAALNAKTGLLVLTSDVSCSFAIGPSGTVAATASNRYLPANTPVLVSVPVGAGYAVAGITNS